MRDERVGTRPGLAPSKPVFGASGGISVYLGNGEPDPAKSNQFQNWGLPTLVTPAVPKGGLQSGDEFENLESGTVWTAARTDNPDSTRFEMFIPPTIVTDQRGLRKLQAWLDLTSWRFQQLMGIRTSGLTRQPLTLCSTSKIIAPSMARQCIIFGWAMRTLVGQ